MAKFQSFLEYTFEAEEQPQGAGDFTETVVIKVVDFLYNLTKPDSMVPLMTKGTFWVDVSHVKRYLSLKFGIKTTKIKC